MKRATLILTVCLISISPLAAAIDIVFDYSYDTNNFFNPGTADGLAARARMTDVENYFEGLFTDDLAGIIPAGSNHWTPRFTDPATGSMRNGTYDMSVPTDTLIIYLGGRNMSSLGIGGPGGFSANGFQPWFDLLESRGENPTTDFGPWGGAISFDTALGSGNSWNFSADEPEFTQYDFLSVALHEMGHVLGISVAASWNNLVNAGNNTFLGTEAMAEYGGAVPLNSVNSHWDYGTMSVVDGVAQEAAMDPNISNGQRKIFTDLDEAALDDIGWDVAYALVLLEGDANRDGVVSAGDYASVQANFGSTGAAGILGDANGDGVVSAGDYASVQANFGSTASSPAPAPEPTTMALLVFGGVAILRRPRRR